jgi:F-type H+-transporting ATPase subunit a
VEAETTTAAAATAKAAHADAPFNAGDLIMHHILDSRELEIPFTTKVVHLPKIEIGGFDLSITRSVVMMWIAAAVLIVLFLLAARRAKEAVPRGVRGVLETLILYIRDEVARKAIGHDGDKFLGYLLTTFFFILACNILGLIPGMSTPTASISVTAALAILAFLMIQAAGIRQNGFVQHFKNLIPHGLPAWVIPILLPVEILSMFTKPFALCIRLFANMTAGHVVILSLISLIFIMKTAWFSLISVPFAVFVYCLEILVAFLQAFIFTLLTAYLIGMSAHPAH